MAAPEYRIVRSRRGGAPRALTAAYQPLTGDIAQKAFRSSMQTGARANWQLKAWDYLDEVGELRYYVGWLSSSCSRVRLVASAINPLTGLPTGNIDPDDDMGMKAAEVVRQVAGGALGQAQLIKRAIECLSVPGETFVAVLQTENEPDGEWLALSRDEVKSSGQKTMLELPSGDKHEFNKDAGESLVRVWRPHPRRASQADSPVRAGLDSLREIVRTTKTIAKAANSRLIGNGIVLVPNQMSLPSSQAPLPDGQPGPPANLPLAGAPAVERLQDLLWKAAQTAYKDPESMASLTPIFVGVDGDQVNNIQHLRFTDEITEVALKTRNDAIARLAMALDVSPERLLGLGSSTNHWSAWQIGDNDVQLHIAPVMELLVQTLNGALLRQIFIDEGVDPDKYMLWFDPTGLTADPDKSDDASDAFDRGTITAEAYRDFLNLGDTGYDFKTIGGWEQWAVDQIAKDPQNAAILHKLVPAIAGVDLTPAIEQGDGAAPGQSDTTNEGKKPDTADDEPGEDQGTRGRKESVGKSNSVVVELLVGRALDIAGKRRRSHAVHSRLPRDLKAHEVHRYMDPAEDREIDRLIKGWDDAVQDATLMLAGMDPSVVRREVERQVRAHLLAPAALAP